MYHGILLQLNLSAHMKKLSSGECGIKIKCLIGNGAKEKCYETKNQFLRHGKRL